MHPNAREEIDGKTSRDGIAFDDTIPRTWGDDCPAATVQGFTQATGEAENLLKARGDKFRELGSRFMRGEIDINEYEKLKAIL